MRRAITTTAFVVFAAATAAAAPSATGHNDVWIAPKNAAFVTITYYSTSSLNGVVTYTYSGEMQTYPTTSGDWVEVDVSNIQGYSIEFENASENPIENSGDEPGDIAPYVVAGDGGSGGGQEPD